MDNKKQRWLITHLGWYPQYHYITENVMPNLSGSAWKTLTFIFRKTLGWRKNQDRISISQISDGCKMAPATVSDTLTELEGKGYIFIHPGKGRQPNLISLNEETLFEIDEDWFEGNDRETDPSQPPKTEPQNGRSISNFEPQKKVAKATTKERSLSFSNENDRQENFIKCSKCSANAIKSADIDTKGRCPTCLVTDGWKHFFPHGVKTQPKTTTASHRKKIDTRWRNKDFRESWWVALKVASTSPTLILSSWFDFAWFVKNDDNWTKLLSEPHHWMHWKDERDHKADMLALQRGQLTAAELVARNEGRQQAAGSYAPLAAGGSSDSGSGWTPQ